VKIKEAVLVASTLIAARLSIKLIARSFKKLVLFPAFIILLPPFESQALKDYNIEKYTHICGKLESDRAFTSMEKQWLRKDFRRLHIYTIE
jgi:hypothetical protein